MPMVPKHVLGTVVGEGPQWQKVAEWVRKMRTGAPAPGPG